MRRYLAFFVLCLFLGSSIGCTVIFQKGRRSDLEKINTLSDEIDRLSKAKSALEDKLAQEIADKQVKLSMQDRGLVVTFLSEVLFDSGKADIKKEAYSALDKVAEVLSSSAQGMRVGIEGHTDNVPITHSKWKDNWQLSGERAQSVLRYMVKQGIEPARLSFIGYGENHPVASNDTADGRRQNRRVEVIILPDMTKAKQAPASNVVAQPKENLK